LLLTERPLQKFLLLCNRVRSYELIIAYHVYYDYYKIDRNKQSKIRVHETDILNSHFTEHFYRQSRLTAVEQITFHANKYWPFTAHENTLPPLYIAYTAYVKLLENIHLSTFIFSKSSLAFPSIVPPLACSQITPHFVKISCR
jgi:hypothetical protein